MQRAGSRYVYRESIRGEDVIDSSLSFGLGANALHVTARECHTGWSNQAEWTGGHAFDIHDSAAKGERRTGGQNIRNLKLRFTGFDGIVHFEYAIFFGLLSGAWQRHPLRALHINARLAVGSGR